MVSPMLLVSFAIPCYVDLWLTPANDDQLVLEWTFFQILNVEFHLNILCCVQYSFSHVRIHYKFHAFVIHVVKSGARLLSGRIPASQ